MYKTKTLRSIISWNIYKYFILLSRVHDTSETWVSTIFSLSLSLSRFCIEQFARWIFDNVSICTHHMIRMQNLVNWWFMLPNDLCCQISVIFYFSTPKLTQLSTKKDSMANMWGSLSIKGRHILVFCPNGFALCNFLLYFKSNNNLFDRWLIPF